jgi:hypothetical protein
VARPRSPPSVSPPPLLASAPLSSWTILGRHARSPPTVRPCRVPPHGESLAGRVHVRAAHAAPVPALGLGDRQGRASLGSDAAARPGPTQPAAAAPAGERPPRGLVGHGTAQRRQRNRGHACLRDRPRRQRQADPPPLRGRGDRLPRGEPVGPTRRVPFVSGGPLPVRQGAPFHHDPGGSVHAAGGWDHGLRRGTGRPDRRAHQPLPVPRPGPGAKRMGPRPKRGDPGGAGGPPDESPGRRDAPAPRTRQPLPVAPVRKLPGAHPPPCGGCRIEAGGGAAARGAPQTAVRGWSCTAG